MPTNNIAKRYSSTILIAQIFIGFLKSMLGSGASLQMSVNYNQTFCNHNDNLPNKNFIGVIFFSSFIILFKLNQINGFSINNHVSDPNLKKYAQHVDFTGYASGTFIDVILYINDINKKSWPWMLLLMPPVMLQGIYVIYKRWQRIYNNAYERSSFNEPAAGLSYPFTTRFINTTPESSPNNCIDQHKLKIEIIGTGAKTMIAAFALSRIVFGIDLFSSPLSAVPLFIAGFSGFVRYINYKVKDGSKNTDTSSNDNATANTPLTTTIIPSLKTRMAHPLPANESIEKSTPALILTSLSMLCYIIADLAIYTLNSRTTLCTANNNGSVITSDPLSIILYLLFIASEAIAYAPNSQRTYKTISTTSFFAGNSQTTTDVEEAQQRQVEQPNNGITTL